MPGQISHIIAGEEALERALAPIAALGEAAPWFHFGCQGPDIFYHNRRTMPSGLHYGTLAHRRNYGSLVAGAAASLAEDDRRPDRPLGAYILGLATHAAVDRAAHPFIIYFAGWVAPSRPETQRLRGCHPFLERILDMAFLERRLGLRPPQFGLAGRLSLHSSAAACEDLVPPWEAGLRAAFPRSTDSDRLLPQRIANALADALHFYAVTAPERTDPEAGSPGGHRNWLLRQPPEEGRYLVSIVYPRRLPEGMDAMNESGREWLHPSGDGRSSTASYLDLMEEGATGAQEAISRVLAFWRGEIGAAELAGLIGEGGLALSGSDGENLPPRLSHPLALSEAMEAEYAARVTSSLTLPSAPD
jgi:hypothetical protein